MRWKKPQPGPLLRHAPGGDIFFIFFSLPRVQPGARERALRCAGETSRMHISRGVSGWTPARGLVHVTRHCLGSGRPGDRCG